MRKYIIVERKVRTENQTLSQYQGQYNIYYNDTAEYFQAVTDWSLNKDYIKELLDKHNFNIENQQISQVNILGEWSFAEEEYIVSELV